jgi:phosphonate ABC transporter permease subunit PhnE
MNSSAPPPSQTALRRLLIVLAIVVGVVVYAYGWQVTDIDIEETQKEDRQASVQRALRELFAPDIFDRDSESVFAQTNFQINCTDTAAPPEQPQAVDGPYIQITPACGTRGDVLTVEGFNFEPHTPAVLRWIPPAGERRPLQPVGAESNVLDTDGEGHFQVQIAVPAIRGSEGEIHQIEAEARIAAGAPYLSATSHEVLAKMIETVFLALMATTIAIPIAVVVSFLAAHNLMRPIHMPLGNVLIGFILLPVGWLLGMWILGPVGQLGVTWGKGLLLGILGPLVATVAYGFGVQAMNRVKLGNGTATRIRTILERVLLTLVIVFMVGAIGGLSIWLGEQFAAMAAARPGAIEADPLKFLLTALGNFTGTIGTLIELSINVIAALVGAVLLASTGMELSIGLQKKVSLTPSYVLGGILGALGGALLLALLAGIGTLGALLGLLTPVAAALLGSQVAVLIYNRWLGTNPSLRNLLAFVSAIVIFALTYSLLGLSRSVIDARLPAELPWIEIGGITINRYFRDAAFIGAVLGGLMGALSGIHADFPVGAITYNVTRTILNALRSIEPLIMGIVFVIWVGIGPFAGVLALMLHSVASLGKLYSEQIESIDSGPIEAILATGASRLQMIVYAVVPQIVPPFIAFTMYRWDINVRMSTIIGFVGGGGIGFLLKQQIDLLHYNEAGVAVLAIAIVVSVLDYASAYIRERMV